MHILVKSAFYDQLLTTYNVCILLANISVIFYWHIVVYYNGRICLL